MSPLRGGKTTRRLKCPSPNPLFTLQPNSTLKSGALISLIVTHAAKPPLCQWRNLERQPQRRLKLSHGCIWGVFSFIFAPLPTEASPWNFLASAAANHDWLTKWCQTKRKIKRNLSDALDHSTSQRIFWQACQTYNWIVIAAAQNAVRFVPSICHKWIQRFPPRQTKHAHWVNYRLRKVATRNQQV